MRITKRSVVGCTTVTALAVGAAALLPSAAFAHGYVGAEDRDPAKTALTARAAMAANGDIGPIRWEPQSLEAPKGFPAHGPEDGHLASAGNAKAVALDEQTEDRWVKNAVETGEVTVDWTFTAPHQTSQWRYYMTKAGWDPNDELDRDDLELIETVEHDGSAASNHPSHQITIPEDRQGYHVIYAVWDVADTANAFYNVIDVDVTSHDDGGDGSGNGGEDTTPPSMVGDPRARAVSPTRVHLDWNAATDDVGVDHYAIWDARAARFVQTLPASARSTDIDGLAPSTRHAFAVVAYDAAGHHSAHEVVVVDTPAAGAELAAPQHLHGMGRTTTSIDLMWSAGDDTDGVRYEVLRDGAVVGTTEQRTFTDRGLRPGTVYEYQVRAVAGERQSDLSATVRLGTDEEVSPEPGLPAWDPFGQYVQGDRVVHDGVVYEAVQTHQGHGDPNWITALSLWKPVV